MKQVSFFIILLYLTKLSFAQTYFSSQKIIDDSGLSYPYGVFAADLDGDGYKDILVANAVDKELVWYKNNGDGTFLSKNVIETLSTYPFEVIALDMDGDNDKDIVCSSFVYQGSGEIRWYKNDGTGNFSSTQIRSVTDPDNNFNYINTHTGDIDKDGDYDIATACSYDSTLIWYENDGTGNLTEHLIANHIKLSDYQEDLDLYIADINNDNQMEIVYSADSLEYYSYSDGFVQKTAISNYSDNKIAVADINQDGYNEFYLGHRYLIYLINNQDGTFNTSFVDNNSTINNVFAADLNKNGYPDLLAAYDDNGSSGYLDKIMWFENDGSGTFTANTLIDFSNDAGETWGIYAADLDNDGDLDVIASSPTSNKVVWVENYTLEILKQPQDTSSCDGLTAIFSLQAKDADSYQWQVSTDGGSSFSDITDDATYTGASDDILLINYSSGMNGYLYRCNVSNLAGSLTSDTVQLSADETAPQITQTQDTIYINTGGNAYLYAYSYGVNDAVEITDTTFSPQSIFDCAELGNNSLTLSVNDACGNSTDYLVTVLVKDTISPALNVHDFTLYLNVNGNANLNKDAVVGSASDNCSVSDTILSQSIFNCNNLGDNNIKVTINDYSGNEKFETCIVTVADTINPEIICPNDLTVTADGDGSYTVEGTILDANASDNCSYTLTNTQNNSETLNGETFQVGTYTIAWLVSDYSGNQEECQFNLKVENQATSLESINKLNIKAYPNPVSNILTLKLNQTGVKKIVLTDLSGKVLEKKQEQKTFLQIDMSRFNKGIYLLNVITVDGNSVIKVVK